MTLLTADDVLNVKFQVSSFKEGYNQDEVDEFLDEVTTTMREFEERLGTSQASSGPSHRKAEILLTSEGVRNIRFSTTRWSTRLMLSSLRWSRRWRPSRRRRAPAHSPASPAPEPAGPIAGRTVAEPTV